LRLVNEPAEPAAVPDDADDLRGYYLRLLLGKGLVRIGIVLAAAVGAVAGAAFGGPALGAAGFAAGLAIGLIVVFALADSHSEDAFFQVYGESRNLAVYGRGRLPRWTPLLRKGDDRYAERALEGALGDGVEGTLALYTYEEESTDSDGDRQTNYYRYTIGLTEVPECAGFVPELYCRRKSGLRSLEKLEDVFRRGKERVKFESAALEERYEIFAGAGQDGNRLRQLFSPAFIVWLSEAPPEGFAFELVGGYLCCYVKGHKKKAVELDILRACTAAVATRLSEEALE
jgi:hypothetical protein